MTPFRSFSSCTLFAAFCSIATSTHAADTSAARKDYIKTQLTAANQSLTAELRQEKYQAMEASSYDFYRGSAYLFYKDIQMGVIPVPSSWPTTSNIRTWISGDFHTQNVGFFGDKNGNVIFDLNDFDESFVAPFYYDLIRGVASIHLTRGLTSGWNLSLSEAEDISFNTFLVGYQNTLSAVNGNSSETTITLDSAHLTGFVKTQCQSLQNNTNTQLLDKWTTLDANGKRIFDLANPDLAAMTTADLNELSYGCSSYLTSVGSFYYSKPASYWTIKDRAQRLHSGLGSLGSKKYYVLLEGPSTSQNDDILLEVKQEKLPSMLSSVESGSVAQYNNWFFNHGQRAYTANKACLNQVDNHYGYMVSQTYSYLVRTISQYKFSFDNSDFGSKSDFTNFISTTAQAVAYAHARSDKDYNTTYVSYNAEAGILSAISAWPSVKTTISTLGENYADQVRADWTLFLQLRSSGQL